MKPPEVRWVRVAPGGWHKTFYDQYNLKLDYPEKWHREEESVPLANLCRYPD